MAGSVLICGGGTMPSSACASALTSVSFLACARHGGSRVQADPCLMPSPERVPPALPG